MVINYMYQINKASGTIVHPELFFDFIYRQEVTERGQEGFGKPGPQYVHRLFHRKAVHTLKNNSKG